MKILYVTGSDISIENSVLQKIQTTIKEWEKFGVQSHVLSLVSKYEKPIIKNATILRSVQNKSFFQKLLNYSKDLKKLNNILSNINPDIIYTRQLRYTPCIIHTIKKHCNYVVEINSDDVAERKLKNDLNSKYILFTRNLFFKKAAGFVFVTNELSKSKNFTKYKKPYTVIANGIDTDYFNNSIREVSNKPKIRFVFIGSPNQPWHGLDKILELAKKLPDYTFNIIGQDNKLLNKKLNNVVFHGYLPLYKAKEVIQNSDIGISSLSIHIKNMNEACSLKTRQYIAQGLPIIVGYDDTDFIGKDLNFVLNIGNYENNVNDNIDKIIEFSNKAKNINPNYIVKFAEKHLDLSVKEKKRLKFITKFI